MKKTLLTLAAAFMATVGTWATDITATLTKTASASMGAAAANSSVDAEKEYFNNDATTSWAGFAFAQFDFAIPAGEAVTSATLSFKTVQGGKSGRTSNLNYINAGTAVDLSTITAGAAADAAFRFDGSRTAVGTFNTTAGNSKEDSHEVDVTDAIKAMVAAGQNNVTFQFTGNAGGATIYGSASENKPVLTIVTASASSISNYTINFTEDGTTVLKSSVIQGTIGDAITLTDADKAPFTVDAQKYIYVSDDASTKTVEAGNATVVTVKYRKAATYNYSIVASIGSTLATGSNFEGETIQFAYPYALNVGGTLYTSKKLSSDGKGYYTTFNLTEDEQVYTVTYTQSEVTDIVYFSEGEDITGTTLCTNSNTAIRSSNGKSAYAESDVTVTTLTPGKYKLTAVICDANKTPSKSWTFLAGTTEILNYTPTAVNWATGTSEEFTVTTNTDIILKAQGSKNEGVDFLYIQKTGDVNNSAEVTVGPEGAATYVAPMDLDFSATTIKAYAVKINEADEIELTQLGEVAKGEAVLLLAEGGATENIHAATGTPSKLSENDNMLYAGAGNNVESTENYDHGAGYNYVLSTGAYGVGFYRAAGLEVPANKAYLYVFVSSFYEAKDFLSWDAAVNAIKPVVAAEDGKQEVYNLAGQRVASPTKGIYIVNGKKVIIK